MIAALVIALAATHTWSWSPVADADGYRLYWSMTPYTWDRTYSVDVGNMTTYDDFPISHLTTPQPGGIFHFVVTSYNAAGESITEHGNVIDSPAGVCP